MPPWPLGGFPPPLLSSLYLYGLVHILEGEPRCTPQALPPKVSLELSPSSPSDGYTQAPAPQSRAHIVVGRGGQGFSILESRVKGQVIVVCA